MSLYYCILVNKRWHDINISNLWKNTFYNIDSTKILINCLLVKEKDFLTKKYIQLKFELLEKPPLHNCAKFTTEIDFWKIDEILESVMLTGKLIELKEKLFGFVLDFAIIKKRCFLEM